MSRNMVAANTTIFSLLDDFCASRGLILDRTGKPRWIASEQGDRRFIINARKCESVSFSSSRKAVRYELDGKHFILTVGFDGVELIDGLSEIDVSAAHITVLLSEMVPKPKASAAQIKDVADAGSKDSNADYSGHDHELIASLFPAIKVYECRKGTSINAWNRFFELCLVECLFQETWISSDLIITLKSVCSLDAERIPYQVLCRSIFDGDPSSFFLALYRCVEALYAYASAKDLVVALGLNATWSDVAAVLEDKLGWHPREEGSLEKLMRMASVYDLRTVVFAIDPSINVLAEDALPRLAASRVYKLRNSIVHFRPAQHMVSLEHYNWNSICIAMSGIVLDVYASVFDGID